MARRVLGQVSQGPAELEASRQAQMVEGYGVHFWSTARAHCPDEVYSQAPTQAIGAQMNYPSLSSSCFCVGADRS